MGTMYTVKLVKQRDIDINYERVEQEIDSTLIVINQQMSTYIDDSEISRFNQSRQTDWFVVSYDLANVIQQSLRIGEKSQGAFDITIGPIVNLWGFGAEDIPYQIPDDNEIDNRIRFTGYQYLSYRLSPPAIKKDIAEIYCDLSAIAKGYGVDKVAEYLDSQSILNYMVEIGGEIRVRGLNDRGVTWKIGISTPDNNIGVQKVLTISDRSLATSGDYWNYFEREGIRYSHTIDPRTGRPITHTLASVTVIHDSCVVADALATAINVLGPEKGYELAVEAELPVFLIVKTKDGFIEKMTPNFEEFLTLQ